MPIRRIALLTRINMRKFFINLLMIASLAGMGAALAVSSPKLMAFSTLLGVVVLLGTKD